MEIKELYSLKLLFYNYFNFNSYFLVRLFLNLKILKNYKNNFRCTCNHINEIWFQISFYNVTLFNVYNFNFNKKIERLHHVMFTIFFKSPNKEAHKKVSGNPNYFEFM